MPVEDLVTGWRELEDALPDYERAERYFEGRIEEVFASNRVRQELARTGERYRFNLCRTPVRVMADRVELASVIVPEQERLTELIELVWAANDLDVHYPDLVEKTFVYGDAYAMVWPVYPDDRDESTLDDPLADVGVEITVHGPKHCRVIYDPESPRRKAYAVRRWEVPSPLGKGAACLWRVDLWYPDRMERWISKTRGNLNEVDSWTPFREVDEDDGTPWELTNEYGEIPFFHHRNALPYGVPEHYQGYGCQDAFNKMLITLITTTDSHGWPQRYAISEKGAELDQSDQPDWDDDAYSRDTGALQGGQSSSIRSGPGTLMDLVGKKSVGQFPAADPEVFLSPAMFFIKLMAQLTTTSMRYFEPEGGAPSGESLKKADAPTAKKCRDRTVMLRSPVAETWFFALRVLGRVVDRLDVRWAPVTVADTLDDWTVVAAKQAAGVPQHQTLVETGYEGEQVSTWLDQQADAMDLAKRAALLKTLAEATQALGAAVGLGVLDQGTASAIVAQVLGQAAPPPGSEDEQ